jgi:hypothetical protein
MEMGSNSFGGEEGRLVSWAGEAGSKARAMISMGDGPKSNAAESSAGAMIDGFGMTKMEKSVGERGGSRAGAPGS